MNKTSKRKPKRVYGSGNRPKKRNQRLKQEVRKRKQQERQRQENRRSYILLGILSGVILLFFLNFHTRQVDGESMLPTLTNNDRLLVQKTRSFSRYDMITFEPSDKAKESYVKRIIGVPGDTLHLEGNQLYLYSGKTQRKSNSGSFSSFDRLPDGAITVRLSPQAVITLGEQTEIPKDQYFVLGDNRENSRDSREMGLISAEQIEGRVVFRYFPLNKIGRVR